MCIENEDNSIEILNPPHKIENEDNFIEILNSPHKNENEILISPQKIDNTHILILKLTTLMINNPTNPNNIKVQYLLENPQLINEQSINSLILKYNTPSPLQEIKNITKIDKIRGKYKTTPPLEKIDSIDFFSNEQPRNLLALNMAGDLHTHLTKLIFNKYEMTKNNKDNQCIYVADSSRKNFIVRWIEEGYNIWKEDKGGIIIKDFIIEPIIEHFEKIISDYMIETINKKEIIRKKKSQSISHDKYIQDKNSLLNMITETNMKLDVLEYDIRSATNILQSHNLTELKNKILNHLANGFYID